MMEERVTVSIACYQAKRYLRRAVESLLRQTYRNLLVVVINDGDPDVPWEALSGIDDRRVVRFDLQRNHGPYFAHQVVLSAAPNELFLIQDADDWSTQDRVGTLLETMEHDRSEMAFSAWNQFRQRPDGTLQPAGIRWRRRTAADGAASLEKGSQLPRERFLFDPELTEVFLNRASHQALFRACALRRIGGYYAGFRMNYDTLLTNLLLMSCKVSFVERPLYCCLLRTDSLSNSAQTGRFSQVRFETRAQQTELYRQALHLHSLWLESQVTSSELLRRIRRMVHARISREDHAELRAQSARLRALLV